MLVRLLYISRPVGPQTSTTTASILATAQTRNREFDISGVLCQGRGLYLQVLEGERSDVNRLYAQILLDRRHSDVEMLLFEEIAQRRFAHWSMAHVRLPDDHPLIQPKNPGLDPYASSGAALMRLVDELLASGHRIELPAG
jgi:hypothetical protein